MTYKDNQTKTTCFFINFLKHNSAQTCPDLLTISGFTLTAGVQTASFFTFSFMICGIGCTLFGIYNAFYIIKGTYFSYGNFITFISFLSFLVVLIVFDAIFWIKQDFTFAYGQAIIIVTILIQFIAYLAGIYWADQLEQTNLIL